MVITTTSATTTDSNSSVGGVSGAGVDFSLQSRGPPRPGVLRQGHPSHQRHPHQAHLSPLQDTLSHGIHRQGLGQTHDMRLCAQSRAAPLPHPRLRTPQERLSARNASLCTAATTVSTK